MKETYILWHVKCWINSSTKKRTYSKTESHRKWLKSGLSTASLYCLWISNSSTIVITMTNVNKACYTLQTFRLFYLSYFSLLCCFLDTVAVTAQIRMQRNREERELAHVNLEAISLDLGYDALEPDNTWDPFNCALIDTIELWPHGPIDTSPN